MLIIELSPVTLYRKVFGL